MGSLRGPRSYHADAVGGVSIVKKKINLTQQGSLKAGVALGAGTLVFALTRTFQDNGPLLIGKGLRNLEIGAENKLTDIAVRMTEQQVRAHGGSPEEMYAIGQKERDEEMQDEGKVTIPKTVPAMIDQIMDLPLIQLALAPVRQWWGYHA